MKFKFIFTSLFLLLSINSFAQYGNFNIGKPNTSVELAQIDFREYSTLVHLKFTNKNSGWIYANEKYHIKDLETGRKYKLLNTFNIPISNGEKVHLLSTPDEVYNFTLEFEKLPDSTSKIDILEGMKDGFNIYGVEILKDSFSNFLDIDYFISDSPIKEYGYYYRDGDIVWYYNHVGLSIVARIFQSKQFGKYYNVNILVQNFTGRDILFNPDKITALVVENRSKKSVQKIKRGRVTYEVEEDKITSLEVLSHNEYIKKVNKKQMWNNIANVLGESLSAMNAGYSTSTTTGQAQIYSNSFGFANGYVGNTYGSVSAYSSTNISAYGSSTTQSYNGMHAYAAQQNARANIMNYENQQNQIKQTLSDGYLKLNTIFNQTEYVGYVNVKYKKGDKFQMNIPINNSNYGFTWDFK